MREDRRRVDELLDYILKAGGPEILPEIDFNRPQGFYYPILQEGGFSPTATKDLEALVSRGDLVQSAKYTILSCPKDGNLHLRATMVCPSCGSEDVHEEVLIEHFRCGHIAPEADFRVEEGLECPKCQRKLKLLGKDFRRPSDFHRCRRCGETTYIPELRLHCPHCGQYYLGAECKSVTAPAYRLREEQKPAAVFALLKQASAVLAHSGYDTKIFEDVEGRSGIMHRCDLYALKEVFGLRTEVLVEVTVSSNPVSPRPLVNLFAKAEDLRISNVIFVAVPELEESANRYASFHGIQVLESDLSDVHDKLPRFLSRVLLLHKGPEVE